MEAARTSTEPVPRALAEDLVRRHAAGESMRSLAASTAVPYAVVRQIVKGDRAAARAQAERVRDRVRKTAATGKARKSLDALINSGAVTAPRVEKSARLPERIVKADAGLSAIVVEQRG